MAKTFKCYLCNDPVSEAGAYAKLALTRWAHLKCLTEDLMRQGINLGRSQVLEEQRLAQEAQARRETQEAEDRKKYEEQAKLDEEIRLRNYASNLPRCKLCGRRMNKAPKYQDPRPIESIKQIYPDIQEPSTGTLGKPDACAACVEAERIASNAAKKDTPKQDAPKPDKKEDPKLDRFNLIDLD